MQVVVQIIHKDAIFNPQMLQAWKFECKYRKSLRLDNSMLQLDYFNTFIDICALDFFEYLQIQPT